MGIRLECITVVIRRDALEKRYPGGFPAFEFNQRGGTCRSDRHLAAVGFMGSEGVDQFTKGLRAAGLRGTARKPVDFAVVHLLSGPGHAPTWLECGQDFSVHFAGAPRDRPQHYLRWPVDPCEGRQYNRFWEFNAAERDRRAGAMLGLAAGDRNGGPTAIAHELLKSLIELDGLYATDVKRRYREWWSRDGKDCGTVFGRVMRAVDDGLPWVQAVVHVDLELDGRTAGCNPAHRCAPLAMSRIRTWDIAEAARMETFLSHRSKVAGDVSAFVAVLCRLLVAGSAWKSALAGARRLASPAEIPAVPASVSGLDAGGHSPKVIQAALFFLDNGRNFEESLDAAVDFAGADNYCPVLVGAIGGARWGASAIPSRQLQHVADLRSLLETIDAKR